jgi:hypothetical protein
MYNTNQEQELSIKGSDAFPEPESVYLKSLECHNTTRKMPSYHSLETLRLFYSNRIGFSLRNYPNLKYLHIMDRLDIESDSLESDSLEHLSANMCGLLEVPEAQKIPNVTTMSFFNIKRLVIPDTEVYSNVKKLYVKSMDYGVYNLEQFPNLEILEIDDMDIAIYSHYPKTLVQLTCTRTKSFMLPTIDQVPNLKILKCSENDHDNINVIPDYPLLESLDCHDSPHVVLPKEGQKLKFLNCSGCSLIRIPDYLLLEELHCSYNKGLKQLPGIPGLRVLYINYNTGLQTIPTYSKLNRLHCTGCPGIILPEPDTVPELKILSCSECANKTTTSSINPQTGSINPQADLSQKSFKIPLYTSLEELCCFSKDPIEIPPKKYFPNLKKVECDYINMMNAYLGC